MEDGKKNRMQANILIGIYEVVFAFTLLSSSVLNFRLKNALPTHSFQIKFSAKNFIVLLSILICFCCFSIALYSCYTEIKVWFEFSYLIGFDWVQFHERWKIKVCQQFLFSFDTFCFDFEFRIMKNKKRQKIENTL